MTSHAEGENDKCSRGSHFLAEHPVKLLKPSNPYGANSRLQSYHVSTLHHVDISFENPQTGSTPQLNT